MVRCLILQNKVAVIPVPFEKQTSYFIPKYHLICATGLLLQ